MYHGNEELIQNEYGFYQRAVYPTEEELQAYYAEKYYNGGALVYSDEYDDEELAYIKGNADIWLYLINKFSKRTTTDILDIGCGEGFSMKHFHESGYRVCGIDYSRSGIEKHNPEMLPFFEQGEILKVTNQKITDNEHYDVILMQNVLEHVTSPENVLRDACQLLNKDGLLLINVPNDFNRIQNYLYETGQINQQKWIGSDHLSYFNKEGLNRFCKAKGFDTVVNLCTELVEMFGFNEDSNYYVYPEKGHNCHVARMRWENLLHDISLEKSIALYEKMADLGIGRNLLGVYRKQKDNLKE